jgi:tripeptide aminopeptidase
VRGGTDGAYLTYMGLPAPNLFTGGVNFHSRTEWVSLQWMEKAVETVTVLSRLWAKETSVNEEAVP